MYHVNDNGDVKRCRATIQDCRFALHGKTASETQTMFETSNNLPMVSSLKRSAIEVTLTIAEKTPNEPFDKGTFYGKMGPREVQLDALNGVVTELEENDATQLVAACGTGKTYMHRQLLRNAMDAEDSNGIGVILTSSIRLAHDTAADLRPEGGYDESLGKFGKDYEVIEVHSDTKGDASVRDNGVISVDRIYKQIDAALKDGKKVVIVSTYDSVSKVQEAQARFVDGDSVQADLLIHDEAHNILGQQKPTTVAGDDNDLTAYVGFHNDIPGSLQARKRLYSTATPIVRETESDKLPTGEINSLIESSLKMRDGDQYERITVYSDDPIVGNVGGFISQSEAIESACLAKPSYEIRQATLKKRISDFTDPVIDHTGDIHERSEATSKEALSPGTYGAVVSTLNAMAADSSGDKNSATNVLAYVGSIDQSEGFKKEFKNVALHESRGISLEDAQANQNSEDPELKRRARMRLLAEKATVMAAHSRPDPESIKERKEAFEMFKGNAVTTNEWTADKRVLANVNIFSEGVSISEIDAVVISDDDKLNEKSMTQAIGRAIRVVPNNDVKKYGHVIIPSVTDADGVSLNSASVNLAAYTATRVERGSTAAKLRGEKISADTSTSFTVYDNNGNTNTKLARDFAQNSVSSVEDLAVAAEITTNRTWLMANHDGYRDLSKSEQFTLAKERINEKLMRLKKDSPSLTYYSKVQAHVANKSAAEVQEIARNGKVVSAALSTGDISSLNPSLATALIKKNVLRTEQKASDLSLDEKRAFLMKHQNEFSVAIRSEPTNATEEHVAARNMLPESVLKNKKVLGESMTALRKPSSDSSNVKELRDAYTQSLNNPEFVSKAFEAVSSKNREKIPLFRWVNSRQTIEDDSKALDKMKLDRQHDDAVRGEQAYSIDTKSVRKTGELNSAALRNLLNEDEF